MKKGDPPPTPGQQVTPAPAASPIPLPIGIWGVGPAVSSSPSAFISAAGQSVGRVAGVYYGDLEGGLFSPYSIPTGLTADLHAVSII